MSFRQGGPQKSDHYRGRVTGFSPIFPRRIRQGNQLFRMFKPPHGDEHGLGAQPGQVVHNRLVERLDAQ